MGHCEQDRLWCAAGDCICTCNRCYVARFETRNEMNAKLAAAEARANKAEADLERARAELARVTKERDALRNGKWAGPWETNAWVPGGDGAHRSATDKCALEAAEVFPSSDRWGWRCLHSGDLGYAESLEAAKAAADAALIAAGWYLSKGGE